MLTLAPAAFRPLDRPRFASGWTWALWIVCARSVILRVAREERTVRGVRLQAALHVARLDVAQDVASGRYSEVPIADAGRESESHVQQRGR
eukprot:519126-Pleurochrysis_carterae.AAC.1